LVVGEWGSGWNQGRIASAGGGEVGSGEVEGAVGSGERDENRYCGAGSGGRELRRGVKGVEEGEGVARRARDRRTVRGGMLVEATRSWTVSQWGKARASASISRIWLLVIGRG
jgi:hypothetical protein